MTTAAQIANARARRNQFVATAMLTGAVPVPAASAAVALESATCVAVISGELGIPMELNVVLGTLSSAGVQSVFKAMFLEGARLIGWFTGPFGMAPLCALGAVTAGLQIFVLSEMTIALAIHGPLTAPQAAKIVESAREQFWEQLSRGAFTSAQRVP
jgi:hypothetical protein